MNLLTAKLKEKFCTKNPKHVLHPFRYFCELCKGEVLCEGCIWYNHKYCMSCDDLIGNASIGWLHG